MGGYFSRRSNVTIVLSTDPVVKQEEIREGCTGTVETPVFQHDYVKPVKQEPIDSMVAPSVVTEAPVVEPAVEPAVAPAVVTEIPLVDPSVAPSAEPSVVPMDVDEQVVPNSPEKKHKKKHRKN